MPGPFIETLSVFMGSVSPQDIGTVVVSKAMTSIHLDVTSNNPAASSGFYNIEYAFYDFTYPLTGYRFGSTVNLITITPWGSGVSEDIQLQDGAAFVHLSVSFGGASPAGNTLTVNVYQGTPPGADPDIAAILAAVKHTYSNS